MQLPKVKHNIYVIFSIGYFLFGAAFLIVAILQINELKELNRNFERCACVKQ